MVEPRRKKDGRTGKINRLALALSIVFMLALIGSIAANVYASGQTSLFSRVEYGSSLQNNQIYVDEELGITFLGTYQNVVLAFVNGGNELWRNEISGAVSMMTYDTAERWLMVGSQDRNIYVYEAGSGKLVNTFAAGGKVMDMDYDQATGRLAVTSSVNASKNALKVIDVHSGEELLNMKLKNIANAIRFSADQQSLFYGDSRARITKIDLNGEQLVQEKARSEVRGLQVVAETGDVLVLDESNNVFRFDSELNKIFSVQMVGEGRAIGTSPDGRWIGVGTREGDTYILDADGNTVMKAEPTVVRRTISKETSDTMRTLIESVVTEGTAKNARVAGFSIGGKTGTSEKIDVFDENGQRVQDKIVSFVGIAPMDDPEYIILAALDTPSRTTGIYISGGVMAAPTVGAVMADVLPYLGVKQSFSEDDIAGKQIVMEDLTGMTAKDAQTLLKKEGLTAAISGSGETVTGQIPSPGQTVPGGSQVLLFFGETPEPETVKVPDFYGMNRQQASDAAGALRLYILVTGNDEISTGVTVTAQNVAKDTEVPAGTTITLVFADTAARD